MSPPDDCQFYGPTRDAEVYIPIFDDSEYYILKVALVFSVASPFPIPLARHDREESHRTFWGRLMAYNHG